MTPVDPRHPVLPLLSRVLPRARSDSRAGAGGPAALAADLRARYRRGGTHELLAAALTGPLAGRLAAVSAFGAESAVLLALVAEIDPATPVIFLETGKHFPQTLAYRDRLAARLGLADLRSVAPDPRQVAARDPHGTLWFADPDGCCELRKVEPHGAALAGFDGLITGRKRYQDAGRNALAPVEILGPRLRLNPLADWSRAEIDAAFAARDLPRHPLYEQGYRSIGCAPCTAPVAADAPARAGRWPSHDKSFCGIHAPAGELEADKGMDDHDGAPEAES